MINKSSGISRQRQKKIVSLVLQYWKRLLLASFCMMIVAGATSAMAFLVKPVIDDIFINKDKAMLVFIPGLAVFVFFIKK